MSKLLARGASPRAVLCAFAMLASCGSAFAQNAVTDWNEILRTTIRNTSTGTPVAARAMAMVNTAVYDAVNSIDAASGSTYYTPYAVGLGAPAFASRDAAAATAAHAVMTSIFPSQAANLDAQLNNYLAGLGGGAAVTNGANWGASVGSTIVSLRTGDGSSPSMTHTGAGGIGGWTGNFTSAHYATMTPFAIPSPSHFRPGSAPDLTSVEYANDWDQVYRLGSTTSVERTADQTEAALFWRLGGGSSTPPGIWLSIAQQAAVDAGMSISDAARMYAAMGVAVADSAICSWDAKVTYDTWRPPTAIHQGDLDGNPMTFADPTWVPLATEASPEYTSGSSTFGASAAAILTAFLGDSTNITLTSEFNNIDVRSWTSFTEMAHEQGMSRIWLGAHFMFSNLIGRYAGEDIADYVLGNYFQVIPAPGAWAFIAAGGVLAARRRRA